MSQATGESASQTAIDSRIEIITPENIAFLYEVAGPSRRAVAYMIDFAIRAAMIFLAAIALAFSGLVMAGIGLGILCVLWLAVSWFYGGLFETFWNGQTPGKWLMGLRVLTREGQPIDALQAILRNVLREVDSFPFVPWTLTENVAIPIPMFTLGLVTMLLSDRYARWGDLASGTMVVVEHRHLLGGVSPVDSVQVREFAASLPANFVPSPSLARALSAYMDRRRYFGVGRRAEIARIVGEPLVERFGLPPTTSHDLLLCALYYHTFIAERGQKREAAGDKGAIASGPPADALPVAAGWTADEPFAFVTASERKKTRGDAPVEDIWS